MTRLLDAIEKWFPGVFTKEKLYKIALISDAWRANDLAKRQASVFELLDHLLYLEANPETRLQLSKLRKTGFHYVYLEYIRSFPRGAGRTSTILRQMTSNDVLIVKDLVEKYQILALSRQIKCLILNSQLYTIQDIAETYGFSGPNRTIFVDNFDNFPKQEQGLIISNQFIFTKLGGLSPIIIP